MAEAKQLSSYEKIIGKLRYLCHKKVTGTFSIATNDNRHASISIKDGRIVGGTYRQLKGQTALENIRQISAGHCTFAAGVLRSSAEDTLLPSSNALFEFLGINKDKPTAAVKITKTASKTNPSESRDEAARKAIEAEATEYLGPIAPTVCEEYFAMAGNLNNKEDLLSVLDGIAAEVGDDAKGEAFKKGVMARLKG